MPSLNHASMADYRNVYEPSDDTYLLIDAIKADSSSLMLERRSAGSGDEPIIIVQNKGRIDVSSGLTVLEIGTGSGVPITYLISCLGDGNCSWAVATDVNRTALEFARKTAEENGIHHKLELLQCDLAGPLLPRCQHGVDIVLFNPPYVPTPDSEVSTDGNIEASWAGGEKGRRVIDRAIPQIAKLLARPGGVAYMVTVDDNEPEALAKWLLDQYDLKMVPLLRRRAKNEYLTVQKISCI
jgi:release factor glutamine methyltransferase